jgi:hypothetical protein
MKSKKTKLFKIPLPSSMHKYLIFAAAMQNFQLIPPTELAMNIASYIMEGRAPQCLESDKLSKLRAYLEKWKVEDFTEIK